MLWHAGRILPEAELTVPASDRTFEHGLGLFESFRTWNGEPWLLPRHLERMTRSAGELGLRLDPGDLPDAEAVRELAVADGFNGDAAFRLTMTGGSDATGRSLVWMRVGPLPPPTRTTGAVVWLGNAEVLEKDPLARHKTLNYWSRRIAFEQARAQGADEALVRGPGGRVWEGSRTNVFMVQDGSLRTPTTQGPVLPGVMRGLVLELAATLGQNVEEVDGLSIGSADEVFLTNALRGVVPVGSLIGPEIRREWQAPGPWTSRLAECVHDWLYS